MTPRRLMNGRSVQRVVELREREEIRQLLAVLQP
jgi:hypothetical protein